MRRIVVTEFVSVDGVAEAPGGEEGYAHPNWVFPYHDDGTIGYKFDEVMGHEAHLLGRVTYESFAGAWPEREGEFADRMNAMPKYVVSSTLTDPSWENTSVVSFDDVRALKEQDGGDLLVAGSIQLVHALIDERLVDEYRLMTFPIVLGGGRRWYGERPDTRELALVDTRSFDSGAVVLTYRPAA